VLYRAYVNYLFSAIAILLLVCRILSTPTHFRVITDIKHQKMYHFPIKIKEGTVKYEGVVMYHIRLILLVQVCEASCRKIQYVK